MFHFVVALLLFFIPFLFLLLYVTELLLNVPDGVVAVCWVLVGPFHRFL